MTIELSRRKLMQVAATGASAATVIGGGALGRTQDKQTPIARKNLFGPDPAKAHLVYNENPFGPSPGALKALYDASTQGAYYQGKSVDYLAAMIAERHNVTTDHIVITNGSYEVLTAIALLYTQKGDILGPELYWDSTSMYVVRNGFGKIQRAPMADGLEIDLDALAAGVSDDISLVQIVNPNNPTGRMLNTRKLRNFCKSVSQKTTVLVDEAYIEMADNPERHSMMDLVREGRDVIVGRTFSKIYGMAGLRVGYIIAKPEIAAQVRSFVTSSPNVAGIAAAIASYNDEAFLAYSKSKLIQSREMITEATKAAGLTPLPSETSFVFVDVGMDANVFRDRMAEKGVIIRGTYGDYTTMSRVSTGHLEDVKRYVAALPYALSGA